VRQSQFSAQINTLWLIGAAWAYVLPMLPFLFTLIAAITWASAIIEAMIAALLWSLTWLRQDNEDFAGRAQMAGLMLLLNVGLRPVLAVLSLCGSYMLLNVALGTVQKLWATAFFGATGGHIAGLSGLIVSLFLLTYIQWHLCIRVFGLIAGLPDRVAQWLEVPTTGQMHEGSHTNAALAGAMALGQRGTPGALPRSQKPGKGKDDSGDYEVTPLSSRKRFRQHRPKIPVARQDNTGREMDGRPLKPHERKPHEIDHHGGAGRGSIGAYGPGRQL
jgi:hypothetical protein